jgi:glyoxylase-like metal-dependent hydrolase (beta-lactamase superfamily II)
MSAGRLNPALEHPFAVPPAPAEVLDAAPGIRWIRMPLPFALDHVNLWLLEDGPGWTLVDTGFADDRTKGLWEALGAGALAGHRIDRILVTHFHPDHAGLASWLLARHDAPFLMPQTEWLSARMLSLAGDEFGQELAAFFQMHGLPDAQVRMVASRGNVYRRRSAPAPAEFVRIRDGDAVRIGGRGWTVMRGEGHAPEHACLWCPDDRILIAGDQILPHITPNVSAHASEPEADPLADFLRTLAGPLADLPDDALVLPSHGMPFRGLRTRIAQLEAHHEDRLAALAGACAEPATAFDVLPVLFRRQLDDHQLVFAMGEAIAHMRRLEAAGRAERIDEGGVLRFRAR